MEMMEGLAEKLKSDVEAWDGAFFNDTYELDRFHLKRVLNQTPEAKLSREAYQTRGGQEVERLLPGGQGKACVHEAGGIARLRAHLT